MAFTEINPKDLQENAIKLIGLDWMLVTAGKATNYNMMTASWGGLGMLWHKPVCFIFIRPSRYTYQFLENNQFFSLTFFEEEYRSVLNFCGSKSGREANKMKEVLLTPVELEETVYFTEARLALLCKKLYYHDLQAENFLHDLTEQFYKKGNFHRMYIGEIVHCLVRK